MHQTLLLIITLSTIPLTTQASRLALIIGNGNYQNVPTLDNPTNDAKDMAAALRKLGFQITIKFNASKRTLKQAVRKFGQSLNNGDVALFYYSGHGLQSQNSNYLVPPEADIEADDEIEFEGFNVSRALVKMKAANQSGVNIMILDACRDNPFQANGKNIKKGLADMNTPTGSLIAYATAPNLASYGDGRARNSIYTKYLLKGLREKPFLSVFDLLTDVTRQVVKETDGKQVPWLSASLNRRFCFSTCASASVEPPITPPRVAGEVFRDRFLDGGGFGPKMVWIPPGSFRMGDIQGGASSDEKPVYRVSIDKFAMGVYEVTFAEYDKFAEATGREKPSDLGWGRGNRPVINVYWNDATAYAKWLSKQTGKQYRLPTEAEWEYAARAGTETKYWWGNGIGKNKANCWNGDCGDSFDYTAPVGSFAANKFGLYDTSGNVWEWTCSEYDDKYNGKEKQCVTRASSLSLRGGSWNDFAGRLRSAFRSRSTPTGRYGNLGFRVSRL